MFWNKKRAKKSQSELRATSLPFNKKVQFETQDSFAVICDRVMESADYILQLSPANYYKDKPHIVQCTLYYNEGYSEIYYVLQEYSGEKIVAQSEYIAIDFSLYQRILLKFGQKVTLSQ